MTLEADGRRNSSGWYTHEFRTLSLARHEASGLSAEVFCQQEGINSKTFSRWRRQARCSSGPGLVLAPVTVLQDVPVSNADSRMVELEIQLKNGRCVRARVAARTDLLAATLGAMEELP